MMIGLIAAAAVGISRSGFAQSDSGKAATLEKIKLGVSPSAGTVAPIIWGQRNGLFAKVGIDLEVAVHTDAGAVVPELLSGQLQFGTVSLGPMISAVDAGVPIRMVSTAAAQLRNNDKFAAIIVPAGFSDTDLRNATKWAAGGPQRDPMDKRLVDALGGNYDKMTIVSAPLGSTVDVLGGHSADAARLFEPFLSRALESGKVKVLTYVSGDLIDVGVPNSPVVASEAYLSANPDIAKRFIQAFNQCFAYAAQHRAEMGAFVAQTGMSRTPLEEHQLPGYLAGIDVHGVQRALDLYNRGFTRTQLTVDRVVWPEALGVTGN
jgi:NitT/TauT family transport system substrate-binding protein